jgi:thiosulfate/3-mercaptopyruvate sulfurtransferase
MVTTDWLEENISAPQLRILDCSVILRPREDGSGMKSASGRSQFEAGHIPGAVFADLMGELADSDSNLPFMMPNAARFESAMSGYGVGAESAVVLYNSGPAWWAQRVWWMLRHFGFDNAAVLDGGFDAWVSESRPVQDGVASNPSATFEVTADRGLFVGPDEVLAATSDADTLLLNALTDASHRGETTAYARPGRIAGSVNVPAPSLYDAQNRLAGADTLREKLSECGAMDSDAVITYCGGGISAATDAFALHLLGHESVRIYDGSLLEWARDPDLPMETG